MHLPGGLPGEGTVGAETGAGREPAEARIATQRGWDGICHGMYIPGRKAPRRAPRTAPPSRQVPRPLCGRGAAVRRGRKSPAGEAGGDPGEVLRRSPSGCSLTLRRKQKTKTKEIPGSAFLYHCSGVSSRVLLGLSLSKPGQLGRGRWLWTSWVPCET